MQKEDILLKIYTELDMIRIMSRFSLMSMYGEGEPPLGGTYEAIFGDIIQRCDQVSEMVEQQATEM